jgi:hypothetical protein
MSFNSLMALLVRGTLPHLDAKPTVMELGNQTLRASDAALRAVIERSRDQAGVDREGLEGLVAQGIGARGARAADYYRLLGFADYAAIDVNERYGSLVMDLNKDLREQYDYAETFDLVTNNGTGEHVFNQDTIYRNVHQLTRAGGSMIHVQPFVDYVNHGFFSIHPNLYHALAIANGYRIVALGVSDRDGQGLVSFGPAAGDAPEPILARETRVSLGVLLSEAKTLARGPRGWLRRFAGKSDARRFGAEIRRLQRTNPKLLCFAILRKGADRAFQIPIQGIYEGDVEDDSLKAEYGLEVGS